MKEKIIDGDLIVHGMLGQMWYIYKKKKTMMARIVSRDSGHGFEEEAEDIGLFMTGNGTVIIGNIHGKRPVKLE